MNIDEIINLVRKRTGMLIGCEEITPLFHFLNGCQCVLYCQGNSAKSSVLPLDFKYFGQYISLIIDNGNSGWHKGILKLCDGNEQKACKRFFELYDVFSNMTVVGYEKAVLSQYNLKYVESMEHGCTITQSREKQPLYINPILVYIIRLSISAFLTAVETQNNIECGGLYKNYEDLRKYLDSVFGKIDLWESYKGSPDFKSKTLYY